MATRTKPEPVTRAHQLGRVPPQDIEAEASVLGAILLDSEAMWRVADILSAQDFYKKAHQTLFEAAYSLFERSEPIDVLSLSSRLKETEEISKIGGTAYLTSLVNSVPSASHAVHYARIVKKKKILRELIEASYLIGELGFKEDSDVETILDEAEKRIFSITQRSVRQDFLDIKTGLEDAFQRLDTLHKGDGALRGIPTGFKGLDDLLAGLQKSDLIILAARPSLGKTGLALDIARNVAKSGIAVGIFSLEMSNEQLIDRVIAAEAGVDLWKLRTGRLRMDGPDNDMSRIQEAMGTLAQCPLYIDDAASASSIQIRTMARRLMSEHDIGLIIVDYLQLMDEPGNQENRVQEVSKISRSLKGLARELNVPVLALSQLSRAVESRTTQLPKLSDLRESGSIEQDADVVMFIYREDKEKPNTERQNVADIIIAKHRNGPVGRVSLYFNERSASFKDLDTQHASYDSNTTEKFDDVPF